MSVDQPWLSDPPVAAPQGQQPNASQPWLNDPPASQDTSYGSALQSGAHDALSGLGATLGVLSKDVGFRGGQTAGNALSNLVPAPANYQSAGGDMAAKLKAGKILGALGDLPRAAVEGAPQVLGGLGSAAVGTALAGPVGTFAGPALYGTAEAFGNNANARAAANQHASPTTGDQLAAGATALGQGGLQAIGLGKVPGVSAALDAVPGLLKAPAAALLDAGGAGASNVAGQVGTTLGTKQGLTVDPAQAEAAALQGASARATGKVLSQAGGLAADGTSAAAGAAKAGVQFLGNKIAASDLPTMSDDEAASFNRINNAYDAQAPAQSGANPTQRMNALWKQQRANLTGVIQGAVQAGHIDAPTATALTTALQQAAVHKSALDTSLLNKLNSSTIDPQLAATIRTGLTDLDNTSSMVNYKQATGPFAALGAKLAVPAAIVGGITAAAHGQFGEAAGLGLGAALGTSHNSIGNTGRALGGVLDRIAGTAQPPSLILRSQALKQAQAAGYDTSGDAVTPVSNAYDALNQQLAQQAAAAAKAKADDLNEAAANKLSGQDYKNSEDGIIARANMAVRKKDILTQAATDGRLQQPMSQDELDRTSIGLPRTDPIPVNTPLDANNQPLAQSPPAAAPRPSPPPQATPPVAPGAAPIAPQSATGGGYSPNGWMDHLSTHLVQKGIAPSPDVINKAVGGLVSSGKFSQDFADHILSNPTQFLGDRTEPFQQIVGQAMQDHGMTPPPIVEQVQSPQKWAASGNNYQALGGSLQNMAAEQGDPELAVAIARIRAISSLQGKLDIKDQVISQRSHDAVALARAKQLLPPELFKGK